MQKPQRSVLFAYTCSHSTHQAVDRFSEGVLVFFKRQLIAAAAWYQPQPFVVVCVGIYSLSAFTVTKFIFSLFFFMSFYTSLYPSYLLY
jgi:hypothetical protein